MSAPMPCEGALRDARLSPSLHGFENGLNVAGQGLRAPRKLWQNRAAPRGRLDEIHQISLAVHGVEKRLDPDRQP